MTTTNGMTCALFEQRLMAYLEQETDDATKLAMDRHAVACAECGALLADLRKLRYEAARLPDLQPSRDLWAGIAARIEAPVVPIGVNGGAAKASDGRRRWTRVALIAASLVAAAGLGYVAAERRTGTMTANAPVSGDTNIRVALVPDTPASRRDSSVSQAPRASVTSVASSAPVVAPTTAGTRPRAQVARVATNRAVQTSPAGTQAIQVAYAAVSADYDREIARLRALIEQRRNQMDPVTVAIIERNMQVIDTAIAQCRQAIARDPASRFLLEALNQSLETKVELMRTAALLPSRT